MKWKKINCNILPAFCILMFFQCYSLHLVKWVYVILCKIKNVGNFCFPNTLCSHETQALMARLDHTKKRYSVVAVYQLLPITKKDYSQTLALFNKVQQFSSNFFLSDGFRSFQANLTCFKINSNWYFSQVLMDTLQNGWNLKFSALDENIWFATILLIHMSLKFYINCWLK